MFASALGIDKVGINENFFELGGTSLTVAKIAVKAAAEKLPIAFKDIFDYPTVEAMEKYVLSITQSSSSSSHEVDATEHPALDRNQPKLLSKMKTAELGGVLLTGATGFLGIHVLKALLDDTDSKIYCLMRCDKQGIETRLRGLLMYYFSNPYRELFGDRIIPVDGDITDRDSIMALSNPPSPTKRCR
ncbi:MAG: SDR family oxidoreductase [Blautia sp.]|nr:SDR family oxidoreductase [Blautia sp.]